ncbi:hypothetical protein N0V84_001103 [Fusarium piperis]|uniref:Apple domain-containing protein n=1 Tax=Fusarium piperis TaxID=1435070 RepID=A0A9W8WLN8_9HYPO|nr:hypothetical protein N0V84_001103 [Fusarium piperis]
MPSAKVFTAVLAALAVPLVSASPCRPKVTTSLTASSTESASSTETANTGSTGKGTDTTATSTTASETGSTTISVSTTETQSSETESSSTVSASASTTSSGACTYYTPLEPAPEDCGNLGFAEDADGKIIPSDNTASTVKDCGNLCGKTIGCFSFSFNDYAVDTTPCTLYTVPRTDLGFSSDDSAGSQKFYDLYNCFGCGHETASSTTGSSSTESASQSTTETVSTTATATATSSTETVSSSTETVSSTETASASSSTETASSSTESASSSTESASSSTESASSSTESASSSTETASSTESASSSTESASSSTETVSSSTGTTTASTESTTGTTTASSTESTTASSTESTTASSTESSTISTTFSSSTIASTSTTAAPSTTTSEACTYYTPISPAPQGCGSHGTIDPGCSKHWLGVDFSADSEAKCGTECLAKKGCKSYSYDTYTNMCQLYDVPLNELKFKPCNYVTPKYYDIEKCYGCAPEPPTPTTTSSAPPSSTSAVCPKYTASFSQCERDATCGTRGYVKNGETIPGGDNDNLGACAKSCIQSGPICEFFMFTKKQNGKPAKCILYKDGEVKENNFKVDFFYEPKCFSCKWPKKNKKNH